MGDRNLAYGNSSRDKILTTTLLMTKLCSRAMEIANKRKLHCPDFGISRGKCSAAEQHELWKIGRVLLNSTDDPKNRDSWLLVGNIVTNCDGYEIESAHQSGHAVDFFAYVDGKANYEPGNLSLIATCFFEASSNMKIDIDWGGSFRSMSDAPHIEIVK